MATRTNCTLLAMSITAAASERAKAALDAVKAMMPDPALTEKMLRRRLYNREQQRRHRSHIAEEAARLRIEVAELEHEKARLENAGGADETDTILPWKEVSCGILEHIEDSSLENRSLKERCRRHHDLIRRITAWVSTCRVPMVSDLHDKKTWRHVTLLSHPPTRKLGFDWITQQLYHNADAMFRANSFPSLTSREYLGDFRCDSSVDDSFQYTWRVQRDLHVPFDQVVRTIQENVVHYLVGAAWSKEWSAVNVLSSVPLDTPLLQEIGGKIAYGRTHRSADEDVNFLCREFTEDGKLTIVAQHIHEDENLPQCKVQCNRMFWVTVDRISDDISTLRVLFMSSHYFTQEGCVPFEDECHYHWGLDLSRIEDENAKLASFHQHITRAGNEFVSALGPVLDFL